MHPFERSLRNAQGSIPSLVPRTALTYNKHAGLILEKFTNLISAQIPHLRDFRNGVVPFGGYRSEDADGSSRGLKKRFFRAEEEVFPGCTDSDLPSGCLLHGVYI